MDSLSTPMQNTSRRNFFSNTFLFGLFLLAASLPYSKFTLSLSLIILLLSWLLGGDLKEKFGLFFKNKIAVAVSSLFFLHLLGLLYTSDFKYGIEDINKKLPLFLLPLMFSSVPPLTKQIFDRLMGLFVLSVVVATFISLIVLLGLTSKQILHPQEASLFISHIRFGLLISMTVFILGYFFQKTTLPVLKIAFIALIIWLVVFLIMMESATGLVCTVVALFILFVRMFLNIRNIVFKITMLLLFFIGCLAIGKVYYSVSAEFEHAADSKNTPLPTQTKAGNSYTHDTLNQEIENGNYVWRNVCETELSETWNKQSKLEYAGKDLRGNDIKYTLIRFLTSKGVNKDAEGVNSLSEKEIQAVEKGIANINFMGIFNPTARLQKIIWEFNIYLKGGNPSGHSVVQRLEFWKAAKGIIQENMLFGVGTGDVKNAFEIQYNKTNSPLTKEWRLRSHNQFLAITVALGLVGLLVFLFTLFFPLIIEKKYTDYLYLTFFIIVFLSMISEDTLENQNGVMFFAFFNSLFLFLYRNKQTTA